MKVMFPNSSNVRVVERLVLPSGRWKQIFLKVRYAIVLHPVHGPILIDTGYSAHSLSAPNRSLMLRLYSKILAPTLNEGAQAVAVLAQLGFTPLDVKTIIVTHFHADHVSALRAFPNAQFVVNAAAWAKISKNSNATNLRHGIFRELLPDDFAARIKPLEDCATTPDGVDIFGDQSLLAVPLPGHAAGHFGVLINTAPDPVFYAVDTHWMRAGAVQRQFARYPARAILDDYAAFKQSNDDVARRVAAGDAVVFCHDPDVSPFDFARDDR